MEELTPLEQAYKIVLGETMLLGEERVSLLECAGRALAQPVLADADHPPFDRSAMDGFAVRAEDLHNTPVILPVVEDIPAGTVPKEVVKPGQVSRIMTGAPIPEGADSVQIVEKTRPVPDSSECKESNDGKVEFLAPITRGANIRLAGEDARKGDVLIEAGRSIGSDEVGVLASVGMVNVPVFRVPRVCLITTGDEVVEPSEPAGPGMIRNSNSYLLAARAAQLGAWPEYIGIAPDNREATRDMIVRGLQGDFLVLTGGVSAGVYDLVPEILAELGVKILFKKVRMKPGKPVVFGTYSHDKSDAEAETTDSSKADRQTPCLVFGLPGNPVSSAVVFQLFVEPAIRKTMGHLGYHPARTRARLTSPLRRRIADRTAFLACKLEARDDDLICTPTDTRGSGDLIGFSRRNALAIFPVGVETLPAGEMIEVIASRETLEDLRAEGFVAGTDE